jgi:hypothetical protein
MMFLANLQTKLGLTPEQGESMMKNAQQKILMEELEDVMSFPAPSAVKAFREKINSMGLSLADDVGVSAGRMTKMFEVEVSPGLESWRDHSREWRDFGRNSRIPRSVRGRRRSRPGEHDTPEEQS